MKTLTLPTKTLHGSGSELQASLLGVRTKVRALGPIMQAAAPNGRDYYPQGPDALMQATHAFCAYDRALLALEQELYRLADFGDEGSAESNFEELALACPEKPPVTPTVHSNGTSREALKADATSVFRAAGCLEEDFRMIAPNGRDYNTPADWIGAREQHASRVLFIRKLGGYFLQLAMSTKAVAA